jgi:hypothetical protein
MWFKGIDVGIGSTKGERHLLSEAEGYQLLAYGIVREHPDWDAFARQICQERLDPATPTPPEVFQRPLIEPFCHQAFQANRILAETLCRLDILQLDETVVRFPQGAQFFPHAAKMTESPPDVGSTLPGPGGEGKRTEFKPHEAA